MNLSFSGSPRVECGVLAFLIILLGTNALVNAAFGFFMPVFLATVPLATLVAFFFPRSGFVASVTLTIFFERFFTLQPIVIGESVYKLYPLDIILGTVFVSAALLWLKSGKEFLRLRTADFWFFSFLIFVTLIFFISLFGWNDTLSPVAFSTWKNYVFYPLTVLFLAGMARNKADLRQFGKLFLVSIAAASSFLVIGIVRGEGLWTQFTPLSTPGIRLLAFPHAYYFSLALLIILFTLPFWSRKEQRYPLWISLFTLVLVVGIFGSLMRHLWLGLSGAFVFALARSPWQFGKNFVTFVSRFIAPAVLIMVGAWYVMAIFPESDTATSVQRNTEIISERIVSIGNRYDESLAWRGKVWESSLQRFAEKPVFGIGFGSRVPVEMGEDYRQYVEVRDMHNSWLAMLIQTGIAGITLFSCWIIFLIGRFFSIRSGDDTFRTMRFALEGIVVFQALVAFSQPYLETNLLGLFFWITLGLIRALMEREIDTNAPDYAHS